MVMFVFGSAEPKVDTNFSVSDPVFPHRPKADFLDGRRSVARSRPETKSEAIFWGQVR